MNKFKYLGCLVAVSAMALSSCNDDNVSPIASGKGRLAPVVEVNTSAKAPKAAASRVEYDEVTASMLSLKLSSADESRAPRSWNSIDEFDTTEDFPIGAYTMEVSYGDPNEEGFGKPYYYGSANIRVKENETTPVSITATLAKAMFTVSYTDALKSYLQDYDAELLSEGSTSFVAYGKDETALAYMRPGKVSVYVNITTPNATAPVKVKACDVDAQARYIYNVTVDYNGGELGTGAINVTITDALDVVEDVTIDLSDELFTTPAPQVTISGFTSGEAINVVEGDSAPNPLKVSIIALGGLSEVNIATTAPSLTSGSWPASANLIGMPAATQAAMKAQGFDAKGVWKNPDQMAVLDFTGVVANLKSQDADHTVNEFVVTVVDQNGKTSDPVSLVIDVERVQATITSVDPVFIGANELTCYVDYNGTDLANNVQFSVSNNVGTWSTATVTSVTPVSRAAQSYKVVLAIPTASGNSFKLHATTGTGANATTTADVTITPITPNFTVSVNENDVWAKQATVAVKDGDTSYASIANVWLSTDGSNYTKVAAANLQVADGNVVVKNLTPGTAYSLKAGVTNKLADAKGPFSFTTEAAAQLPGSDMETWTRTDGQTNYWWIEYPPTGWSTVNEYTTSEGGNNTSAFSGNRNGMSYCAFSGTRVTTDSYSGNAAIIETVGWGKGSSATGNANGAKHVTAGELYIGSYSGTAQYGMSFASRPSSISFYYKYSAKNAADYGYAEIAILDAADNVIATATEQLTAVGSYTLKTLPLNYTVTAKAAKIKVIFKSSGNSTCLQADNAYLSAPGFANTTDGRFIGSALYIDEISLNY